jgi:error-prone DNA polymerase
LRRYFPGEFLCALMNAQPMGFYPPSSLVRDAQRRGVEVLAPHINLSEAQCDIENGAVRVGLAYVQAVGEEDAKAIVVQQPYTDLGDLARRASANQDVLEALVAAGACDDWGSRRELLWRLGVTARGETVRGGNRQLALPLEPTAEIPELPEQTPWERMLADYKHTSLLGGRPPAAAAAASSQSERVYLPRRWSSTPNGSRIEVAGMAIARQRPCDREGNRLSCCSRTSSTGEPDRAVAGLRGASRHRARRAMILARGKLERSGRNINLLVATLASLRPARSPCSERSRSRPRSPARASLRPPLSDRVSVSRRRPVSPGWWPGPVCRERLYAE